MQYLAILGRQPEFGLAELESLLGAAAITPLSGGLAIISTDKTLPFARFGSVMKFARLQTAISNTNTATVIDTIVAHITETHPYESGVKLKIGVSDYSKTFSSGTLNKLGLSIKKILKSDGYSVRIVPNKSTALGSAQVIHNNLTAENGVEVVLFKDGNTMYFATTVYEQDIEGYTARDQARPMRDARVGMLPPKLAQTIINLATGTTEPATTPETVLDPFCGTGVILQEAGLMGYSIYGTDLEERMIRYSRDNIQWLKETHDVDFDWYLEAGDAVVHKWRSPIDYIAAETYLGRPLTAIPSQNELMNLVQSVNTLHKKVLQNIHGQISSHTRICLAVPAWRTKNGFVHLPVLDQLDKMGYNQLVFSHVDAKNLVYARADQIVARQLVVITKQ